MGDYYTRGKEDKLDFKQICLGHFKKILELTTKEFCGGYWNFVYIGNVTNKVYVTDSRAEYCQAVEGLMDILFPYFDKKMKEDSESILKKLQEAEKKYLDEIGMPKSNEENIKYSVVKLKLMRKMFRALGNLMEREKYFKRKVGVEGLEGFEEDIIEVDGAS